MCGHHMPTSILNYFPLAMNNIVRPIPPNWKPFVLRLPYSPESRGQEPNNVMENIEKILNNTHTNTHKRTNQDIYAS